MKRTILALILAAFAGIASAQTDLVSGSSDVWAQDHNFIAPPQ